MKKFYGERKWLYWSWYIRSRNKGGYEQILILFYYNILFKLFICFFILLLNVFQSIIKCGILFFVGFDMNKFEF